MPKLRVLESGTALAFSAAQLPASSNDTSVLSRISSDTRTVWQGDLSAGRAVLNGDGKGKVTHWSWITPPTKLAFNSQAQPIHKPGATS